MVVQEQYLTPESAGFFGIVGSAKDQAQTKFSEQINYGKDSENFTEVKVTPSEYDEETKERKPLEI